VATIITILRDEAGLNARSGIDDDPALNDTALVVDGQLRAADRSTRSPRNPVDFRSGVVAEIAVSRTSDGKKAQLLAFAAQAQKGVGAGPLAEAQNAAIKAALASQSVPTQNLSPDIEAQARGLGRAIADKITAYAIQQGWVHKADLPERPVDTGPKNQPQKLPAAAAKQSGPSGPTTAGSTIPCNAFTKNDRGNWYVRGPVTINLGTAENRTLHNLEITPKFFTIGGVDLYEAIQKACGGSQRR